MESDTYLGKNIMFNSHPPIAHQIDHMAVADASAFAYDMAFALALASARPEKASPSHQF